MPSDTSFSAALMLQPDGWKGMGHPDGPEALYREVLQQAIDLNGAKDFYAAREVFLRLYALKGHYETRLSAANMTLKLGEVYAPDLHRTARMPAELTASPRAECAVR